MIHSWPCMCDKPRLASCTDGAALRAWEGYCLSFVSTAAHTGFGYKQQNFFWYLTTNQLYSNLTCLTCSLQWAKFWFKLNIWSKIINYLLLLSKILRQGILVGDLRCWPCNCNILFRVWPGSSLLTSCHLSTVCTQIKPTHTKKKKKSIDIWYPALLRPQSGLCEKAVAIF